MGISNDGLIFALTNGANGTIHGFGNTGTINTVTNDLGGTIESGFFNSGSVYIFTNAGLISSTIPAVINSGTIDTLTNSGSIISSLMGLMNVFGKIKTLSNSGNIIGSIAGLTNMGGTIGTLTNAVGGVIGGVLSVAISNSADGIIGTLSNSGSIGGGGITGILNTGTILTLTNHDTGTITGAHTGIVNGSSTISGWIGTLTNLGVVSGGTLGTPAIDNSYGTIGTLINAQGGNGTIGTGTLGALTYTGNLPGTYLEYVTSPTHYGQLFVSGGSGTMTFDIAPGSHLNAGTYFNVLELGTFGSIASEVSGTVTGTYNGVTWYLVDPPGTYNLIVPISDTNTRRQLEANRDQVLSAMRARAAVAINALGYDCATFDKNGVCIAFNARYSSLDSVNDGGGVLTGAYRLNETTRIGAFINYSVAQDGLSSVKFGEDMPTFGGFIAYAQKPDGTGVQARLAASYNTGRATITRDDSLYDGTEAGSGVANLTTYAIGGDLGYGFALARDVLATPYAGLRYTDSTRGAYSETTSEAVADPISYNAYVQRLTTATLGVRFNGALTDKLSYQIGLGGEYDLSSVANAYSGTSAISGLEAFALANTASANRLRGNGSVGLAYITAPNQKLSASVSVRGEAYTAKPSTNVLMGYQVGF